MISRKKYKSVNMAKKMDMLYGILMETQLLILFGIVFLAFLRWG